VAECDEFSAGSAREVVEVDSAEHLTISGANRCAHGVHAIHAIGVRIDYPSGVVDQLAVVIRQVSRGGQHRVRLPSTDHVKHLVGSDCQACPVTGHKLMHADAR
jgi:hypothetical protein